MAATAHHDHMPLYVLTQGNMLCTTEKMQISTVLGSCVSVTMHSSNPRMAAICHCMLPRPGLRHELEIYQRNPHRYVAVALRSMAAFFSASDVQPCDVEVKLFGGAEGVNIPGAQPALLQVGKANIEEATTLLRSLELRLRCSHVGGHQARKLIFDTLTGDVWMKLLRNEELQGKETHE